MRRRLQARALRARHEPGKVRVERLEAVLVEADDRTDVAVRADNDDATLVGRDAVLGVKGSLGVLADAAVVDVVRVDVLAVDACVVGKSLDLVMRDGSAGVAGKMGEELRLTSHSVCGVAKM